MKRSIWLIAAAVLVLSIGAVTAGKGYKCDASTQDCLDKMAAHLQKTGWIGIKMSPPTTTVPIVIMTLAIADCVHILVNFLHGMRDGESKYQAMMESLRINLQPIFITTLTTAIGFLSLNFSDAPPFRDLGNMAAMGVVLAFLLSVTFLPAMMMLLPVKALAGDTLGRIAMIRFAEFVVRYKKQLLWGMGIVVLLLISQIPNNRLDDQFVKYFDETIAFRQATDFTTENLTGIYTIEYSLDSGETGGIIWAEVFDRRVDGIFDLRDNIAKQVVTQIDTEVEREPDRI